MKASEQLIEQVLILRCQVGDRDAFAELFERYQAPLRYFISRLLGGSEITEDIFQDTWLTVIRKIHTLRKLDTFPAWLYRIAHNYVCRELRRRRQISTLDENTRVPDDKRNDGFSPEDAAKIHRCLEKLSLEHKEVLMLRFLQQMSYEQISHVTGCNLGTVKSRMYYAKRALKQEMEK